MKENHPKKYTKFANFCPKCTLFRNPQQVREQRDPGQREQRGEREKERDIARQRETERGTACGREQNEDVLDRICEQPT